MNDFDRKYEDCLTAVNKKLRVDKSFDMLVKRITIGGKKATFYCIDGFVKDTMFEKMLEYLSKITEDELKNIKTAEDFLNSHITYIESST